MRLRSLLYLFIVFCGIFSCENRKEDCSTVLCVGPSILVFEVLIDGKNVFENEYYTLEDVVVEGARSEDFVLSLMTYQLENGEFSALTLENSSWNPQDYNINLKFGNEYSTVLALEISLSSGECCGGIPILQSILIGGASQSPNMMFTLNLN